MHDMQLTDSHVCPQCKVGHLPRAPHVMNASYDASFWEKNGRLPTLDDAIAHCSEATQANVRAKGVALT